MAVRRALGLYISQPTPLKGAPRLSFALALLGVSRLCAAFGVGQGATSKALSLSLRQKRMIRTSAKCRGSYAFVQENISASAFRFHNETVRIYVFARRKN